MAGEVVGEVADVLRALTFFSIDSSVFRFSRADSFSSPYRSPLGFPSLSRLGAKTVKLPRSSGTSPLATAFAWKRPVLLKLPPAANCDAVS